MERLPSNSRYENKPFIKVIESDLNDISSLFGNKYPQSNQTKSYISQNIFDKGTPSIGQYVQTGYGQTQYMPNYQVKSSYAIPGPSQSNQNIQQNYQPQQGQIGLQAQQYQPQAPQQQYNYMPQQQIEVQIGLPSTQQVPSYSMQSYLQNNKQAAQDEQNQDSKLKCKICLEQDVEIFLEPCGHTLCQLCSTKVTTCPFDRKKIVNKKKVFFG